MKIMPTKRTAPKAAHGAVLPRRMRRADGVTLVELLAVMLIIGVLVSLVVAVGTWVRDEASRRHTSAIQEIAMEVIQAYYQEVGRYPGIRDDGSVDPDLTDGMPGDPDADETTAVLLEYLRADAGRVDFDDELADIVRQTTRNRLGNLPEGSMDETGRYLLDGSGRRMHYDPEGGLGGRRPVLVSAGPSGDFDNTEDNVRSDGG